jgi:hypothetical protein
MLDGVGLLHAGYTDHYPIGHERLLGKVILADSCMQAPKGDYPVDTDKV